MFWEQTYTSGDSSLLNILDKEDTTLDQLIKEDDLIHECKAQCTKLINFLQKITILTQLVDNVITSPYQILPEVPEALLGSNAESKEDEALYQPSRVSCEILTTENEPLYHGILNNSHLLGKIFYYFENPYIGHSFPKQILNQNLSALGKIEHQNNFQSNLSHTGNNEEKSNNSLNPDKDSKINSTNDIIDEDMTKNIKNDIDFNMIQNAQSNINSLLSNSPIESPYIFNDQTYNMSNGLPDSTNSEDELYIKTPSEPNIIHSAQLQQIDSKIANLVSRTLIHLVSRAPETVLSHLSKRPAFLLSLNMHLENSSFTDLLVHLSSKLETERDLTQYSEWFVTQDYIQDLLLYLHPKYEPIIHDNVSTIFTEIYKNSTSFDFLQPGNFPSQPMPLVKEMTSKRTLSTLLHFIFFRHESYDNNSPPPSDSWHLESSIVNALRIFLVILEALVFNQHEDDEKLTNVADGSSTMNKTYDATSPTRSNLAHGEEYVKPDVTLDLLETADRTPEDGDTKPLDEEGKDGAHHEPIDVNNPLIMGEETMVEDGSLDTSSSSQIPDIIEPQPSPETASSLPPPNVADDQGLPTPANGPAATLLPDDTQCTPTPSTATKMESEDSGVQEEEEPESTVLEDLAHTVESFQCYLENPERFTSMSGDDGLREPALITTIDSAIGGHVQRFGQVRYLVTQVLTLFVVSNEYTILRQVHEFDTVGLLMKYFFHFPWNSLLHTQLLRTCSALFANLGLEPNQVAVTSLAGLRSSLGGSTPAGTINSTSPTYNRFKPHARPNPKTLFSSLNDDQHRLPESQTFGLNLSSASNGSFGRVPRLEDVVTGGNRNPNLAIVQQLIIEDQFFDTVIDAWQENEDAEILKHPRRAYMGHLIELANLVNSHLGIITNGKASQHQHSSTFAAAGDAICTETLDPNSSDSKLGQDSFPRDSDVSAKNVPEHPLLQGLDPDVYAKWVEFSQGPLAKNNALNRLEPVDMDTSRHNSFSFNITENYFNESYLEELSKSGIDNYQYEEEPEEKPDAKFYYFNREYNGVKYEVQYPPECGEDDNEEGDDDDEMIFDQMCRDRTAASTAVTPQSPDMDDVANAVPEAGSRPSGTIDVGLYDGKRFEEEDLLSSPFFTSSCMKEKITPPRRNCAMTTTGGQNLSCSPTTNSATSPQSTRGRLFPQQTIPSPQAGKQLRANASSHIADAVRNVRSRVNFSVRNKTASYDDLRLGVVAHEFGDYRGGGEEVEGGEGNYDSDDDCEWNSADLKSIADEAYDTSSGSSGTVDSSALIGTRSEPIASAQRMTSTPERGNSPVQGSVRSDPSIISFPFSIGTTPTPTNGSSPPVFDGDHYLTTFPPKPQEIGVKDPFTNLPFLDSETSSDPWAADFEPHANPSLPPDPSFPLSNDCFGMEHNGQEGSTIPQDPSIFTEHNHVIPPKVDGDLGWDDSFGNVSPVRTDEVYFENFFGVPASPQNHIYPVKKDGLLDSLDKGCPHKKVKDVESAIPDHTDHDTVTAEKTT